MVFKKFVGVKFSDIYYKNPPDSEILKKTLNPLALKEEILQYVENLELRKELLEKIDELAQLGYVFVNATLNEQVRGHAGSWVEEISIGVFAVKGEEKILLYKVCISNHYHGGRLKHQSKWVILET